MLDRRTFFLSAAALVVSPRIPAAQATAADAGQFIQGLADAAMKAVAVKDLQDAERAARFRTLFVNNFDLLEISRFVLGRYWRPATAEQRAEFQKLFEDIQVYTWTRRFKEYSGETLAISGVTAEENNYVVTSQIKRTSLAPINVQWRVRKDADVFRVVDIVVEGASMAITFRSDYGGVLASQGGKMDGLLTVMRQKLDQMMQPS